jgi:VCBS repeat-containing protein
LEARQLLAGSAVGPVIAVNTFTTSAQEFPVVAMDADGDFVAVWTSEGQDGSLDGVYAQRYNAAGVEQGSEFRVNTYTTSFQNSPSVAMDTDGDFVIVWRSSGQDGSGNGIYGQRYNAAGAAQGSEFRINTYTTATQSAPVVAMDDSGDFVVVWQSDGQDGSGYGIYAQRYNAAGAAQGSEFRVNTHTTNRQNSPAVAMDSDGDFVVVWQSYSQGSSSYGVYAQRYTAAGAAQGSEFSVGAPTENVGIPIIDMAPDGEFVIAWLEILGVQVGGANLETQLQRFDSNGAATGELFSFPSASQRRIATSVAIDDNGDLMMTSIDYTATSGDLEIQRYDATAQAWGEPIPVFTPNTLYTSVESVRGAMDANGNLVVVWDGRQSTPDDNVFAQRFAANLAPQAFSIPVTITEDTPLQGGLLWATDAETSIDQLSFSIASPASRGSVVMTGQRSFQYTPAADFHGTDSFTFQVSDGEFSSTATVTITVQPVNDVPVAFDSEIRLFQDTSLQNGYLWAFDPEVADGVRLTYELVSGVSNGTLTFLANGVFSYVPQTGFVGQDSFRFRVFDGVSFSNTATFRINVFNDPPEAYSAFASTPLNTTLRAGRVWANDPEGEPLTYELVNGVAFGTLTFRANGTFDYVPLTGFSGGVNFTFRVFDGRTWSNVATMFITVTNSAPTAFSANATIPRGTPLTGGRLWAFDEELQPLFYELVTGSPNGSATVLPNGTFSFTPSAGFNGVTTFQFRVFDGTSFSNTATMTITVT